MLPTRFFSIVVEALLVALLLRNTVEGNAHQRKIEKQIIDNIFSSANYDPRVRPSGVNSSLAIIKPLEVVVNMYVQKIHRVDDDKMLFSIDTTFREEWVDERLKFSQTSGISYVNLNDDDDLWTPGLFFNDYKAATHEATTSNILTRIYQNGSVLHSKRYNLLLYCDMDFHDYPFDVQTCHLTIASYAYKGDEVTLKWKTPQEQAIYIGKSLINDGLFALQNFETSAGSVQTSTGDYPYLNLMFTFRRLLPYYGIQIFMPCSMMVIVGYFPLWIAMKHFNTRIVLAVATCYTLYMHLGHLNVELPKTPYAKAVDVFTGVSLTFTFATVLETMLVYVVTLRRTNEAAEETLKQKNFGPRAIKAVKVLGEWLVDHSDNRIDVAAKIIYPGLYLIFTVFYWGIYLC